MRIAHLADVHLGYRAYSRLTSNGVNQREVDVFRAFSETLDLLPGLEPDLVIIAGDLFHSVRPSNFAVQHAFRLLAEFRSRSAAPVVIIGGNHDTPRSTDTGCILDLLEMVGGVFVEHHQFRGVRIPDLDAAVYCLPYFALAEKDSVALRPSGPAGVNILAVHGAVEGVMHHAYDPIEVSPGEMHLDEWEYVAAGHYHIHARIAENACYSGSIEYTSTNIWEECRDHPKGFVIYDTDTRGLTFHRLSDLRPVLDLPVVAAGDMNAAEVMEEVERRVTAVEGGIEKKIARIVVEGFPRQLQKELDWTRLRELRAQALHFELVMRPAVRKSNPAEGGEPLAETRPLEVEWEEFAGALQDVPRGADRQRLLDPGKQHLQRAAEEEPVL